MKESGKSIGLVRGKKEVFCSMPVICFQYRITLEGQWNVLGKMLINYYECIFQNLKRWEKPAPQIIHPKEESLISDIE